MIYKPTNFFPCSLYESILSISKQKTLFVNHEIDSDLSL